jgi:hypothetical protein
MDLCSRPVNSEAYNDVCQMMVMNTNFKLLDVVVLLEGIPEEGLVAGATGTVVEIYTTPDLAYEIEFCDDCGDCCHACITSRSDSRDLDEILEKQSRSCTGFGVCGAVRSDMVMSRPCWTSTRSGQVWSGGVNQTPVSYNPETGLAAPTRPGWE